ncbi:EKC/KEOPS complex subunit TPRKB [Oncorhynchus tshawytscha]|uniref:EKC/KEOPS complex subunit TPRKB n=1 Tax=Oncorhynchus tshawytscha TaxID=74940 RepID=UPI000D09A3C8|nr:EKC/KEOPS complex subunit TPRKB [Oncorhynchus tshawytscha]
MFESFFNPQIRFPSVMYSTQELELFPDRTVTQLLFKDVKNAAELRKNAMEGKINGALINPSMIVNPFQVLVAANKAVHLHSTGKMKTRSLYSEIIYNLSPTNNISEAFKRFGMSDSDSAVLIVLVHLKEETQHMTDIIAKVDGQQIPVEDVSMLTDPAKVKKLYKTTPQEDTCLLDAVVCRMATKDVM